MVTTWTGDLTQPNLIAFDLDMNDYYSLGFVEPALAISKDEHWKPAIDLVLAARGQRTPARRPAKITPAQAERAERNRKEALARRTVKEAQKVRSERNRAMARERLAKTLADRGAALGLDEQFAAEPAFGITTTTKP